MLRGRRRGLPSGRAVTGGFLVAVAAVVVFAAAVAGSNHHGRPYVVATRSLAAGTVLTPDDLGTASMQLPAGVGRQAFTQVGAVLGRPLAVPLQAGELIQTSVLAPAGAASSFRPVSVAADANSLGDLSPGQRVDVLAVSGTGSGAAVSVIMRGAVLLDLGRTSTGVLSGPSTTVVVTLGVSTLSQVEAIVQAAQGGTVSLVAAEPADGIGSGP